MGWIEYINYVGIMASCAMLLRSLFFIITAYKTIKGFYFWTVSISICLGIFHYLYNIDEIIFRDTAVPLIIFLAYTSLVFYRLTKVERDKSLFMTDDLVRIYDKTRSRIAVKFLNQKDKINVIPYKQLKEFVVGVPVWVDGIGILRNYYPFEKLFFKTVFPPLKKMSRQVHPDCAEYCTVVEGEMIDLETGRIYKKGQTANWKAGVVHSPKSNTNEKLLVHVYFEEV